MIKHSSISPTAPKLTLTIIICIRAALFGSFGSSFASAAHLASFFMSFKPDVPMDAIASIFFKALKRQ